MGAGVFDLGGMAEGKLQEMQQLGEELVDVNALGDDEADVERSLEPAAGEDGFFEERFGGGIFFGHGGNGFWKTESGENERGGRAQGIRRFLRRGATAITAGGRAGRGGRPLACRRG